MEENLIIDIIPKFINVPNIKIINKCKYFIILNDKKEIIKYDSSHNHPEKEYDVSLSIMKHKIKDGIEKSSIPFGIKIKSLYNKISNEMGLICPEYNSIKSQISKNLNKKLPSNVTTFSEIPNDLNIMMIYFYQIFITGTYTKELDNFYTTSFAILKNKEQETYKILFEKLKKKNANTCYN
ncbi:hypothetical protein U3516DRAFT_793963 [Neocallimastix sp. 'constans']